MKSNPCPTRISHRTLGLLSAVCLCLATDLSAQPAQNANSQEDVVTLRPFAVVTSQDSGYIAGSATVGSRVNQSLLDIPQTVNVLTSDFLKDTNSFTLDQVFMHVAGAHIRNSAIADVAPGAYLLRGFENNSNYVEGVGVPGYRRDMAGYDRVEVIKGVPSVALGRGDASGSINYVYKKPNPHRTAGSLRTMAGTNAFYRGELDWNQPLNERLAYRLVAAVENSQAFVVKATPHQADLYRFYPSFSFSPSEDTTIVFNGEYLRTNTPLAAYGRGFTLMPAKFRRLFAVIGDATDPITALNLPWGFHLGPGKIRDVTTNSTLSIAHRFNRHLDLRQVVSYLSVSQDEWLHFAGGNRPDFGNNPNDPANSRGIYKVMNYRENHYFDRRWNALGDMVLNFTPKLGNLDIQSTTMIGYALTQHIANATSRQYTPLGDARYLNLADPVFAPVGAEAPINRNQANTLRVRTHDERQAFSYYIEQRLSAWDDKVAVVYGWRDTEQTGSLTNYLNPANPITSNDSKPPASVRVGLFINPIKDLTLYASRSDQTDPTITQFQWTELSPGDSRATVVLTGTPAVISREFGAKGYLFDRRLFLNLAYYKLERSDTFGSLTRVNTESPVGSGQLVVAREHFVTTGDVADGWELEVVGSLTKRLTVSGAIGIGDTFRPVPTAQNPDAGRALPFVPDWDANVFFKYDLRNAQRGGFGFTAGANFLGPIQAYNVGSNLGDAGFMPIDRTQHIFSASVSYAWNKGRYSVSVRGTNLTDDTYIIVRVNEPRAVRATFSMEF